MSHPLGDLAPKRPARCSVTVTLGATVMACVQDDCDGTRHYFAAAEPHGD